MVEKLTIAHIAPYLPCGLHVEFNEYVSELRQLSSNIAVIGLQRFPYTQEVPLISIKPILRPLSDLTKEIEHDGEKFIPALKLFPGMDADNHKLRVHQIVDKDLEIWVQDKLTTEDLDYIMTLRDYTNLFRWHYDVHGLIDAGLAVDINTIEG